MVFNIYSVGDGKLLSDILNSVAMICNSTSFPSLIFAGFMIGIIIIAFQCLISGGRVINLHFALIGMILYMGLFGTKCSVIVSDAYDDIVYEKIDNVPLAVGVTGMGISNIGHGIASMFEQGFGDVQRTDNFAYAEPLRILNQFRTFSENDEVFAKIDLSLAGNDEAAVKTKHIDSRQSVLNYLSECVMANVATGATTASNLFRGNIEAFSSEDEMKMTYLAIPGGGTMTCKDAFPLFKSIFDPISNDPNMIQWVNRIFGVNETADYTKISAAIQDLSYLNQTAQDWMAMSLLRVQYDHAADQFYRQQLDQTAAINLNQAITQKSYQQASEASLFLVSMRIMMALIEGLVYAITPLIAFLICTGSFGMGLVGKYLSMLVWIQLWLPVMSITDLYIRSGARDAVRVAFINNQNYSFFANDMVGTAIQTWIGFGSIAAAATPLIALFLVGGSSVAFTSLTNRMMGSDHFNERALAPDATSTPPILNQAARNEANRTRGVSGTGSAETMIKIGGAMQGASMVAETHANAETAIRSANAAYVEDYKTGNTGTVHRAFEQSWGEKKMSELAQNDNATYQRITSIAKEHNWGTTQTNEAVGQLSLALGLDGGVSGQLGKVLAADMGLTAKVNGQGTNSNKANSTTGSSVKGGDNTQSNRTEQLAAKLSAGADEAVRNVDAKTFDASASSSKSGSFAKSFNDAQTNLNEERKAVSLQRVFSTNESRDIQQIAHNMDTYRKAKLAEYERGLHGKDDKETKAIHHQIAKNYEEFTNPQGHYDMSPDDARAASVMAYLAGSKKYADQEALAKALYGSGLITSGLNAELVNPSTSMDGPHDDVTSKVNTVKSDSHQQMASTKSAIPDPKSKVNEIHDQGMKSVKTAGRHNDSLVNNQKREQSWTDIKKADYSKAQNLASNLGQKGLTENLSEGVGKVLPGTLGNRFKTDPKLRHDENPNNTWDKSIDQSYNQAITGINDPTSMPKTPLVWDFASQRQWEFGESVRTGASPQVIAEKSAALREEIMKARWGSDTQESDLTKGDIEDLNRATRGMQANLINSIKTEHQGNTTKIRNFNEDFGISIVRNSKMY